MQTAVDLVPQELGGGIEKVERNKPIRQATDHAVTIGANRGQMRVLIEQGNGFDRVHLIGFAIKKQPLKYLHHLGANTPGRGTIGKTRPCVAHRLKALREFALSNVERTEEPRYIELDVIPPPAEAQGFESVDALIRRDVARVELQPIEFVQRPRLDVAETGFAQRFQPAHGAVYVAIGGINARGHPFRFGLNMRLCVFRCEGLQMRGGV